MTTNTTDYDQLISEFNKQLNKLYGLATEAKWASEPNSKDRRKMMYVTSALESIISTMQE